MINFILKVYYLFKEVFGFVLVALSYHFEPIKKMLKSNLNEINKEISQSLPILEANLDRLLEYIKKEEERNIYIEIDLPMLDSNLSFKLNRFYKKNLISVMNNTDSEIFGHLIINGYECLDSKELKKLGYWSYHKKNVLSAEFEKEKKN